MNNSIQKVFGSTFQLQKIQPLNTTKGKSPSPSLSVSDSYGPSGTTTDESLSQGEHLDDICVEGSSMCPVKPIVLERLVEYVKQKGDMSRSARTAMMSDICHQSDVARSKEMIRMVLEMREKEIKVPGKESGQCGCTKPFSTPETKPSV